MNITVRESIFDRPYFSQDDLTGGLHFDCATTTEYSTQTNLLSSFSFEQIECICEILYAWRDGARLVHFFSAEPRLISWLFAGGPCCPSVSVMRAYLYALYHMGRYAELFRLVSQSHFDSVYHEELIELWYKARYAEDQQRKHKELGPVEKYRIRKKYPPPPTIFDGDEVVYSFKECARRILKSFYEKNKYPNSEEKREIARQTRLGIIQISNWFKNRRQRDKEK